MVAEVEKSGRYFKDKPGFEKYGETLIALAELGRAMGAEEVIAKPQELLKPSEIMPLLAKAFDTFSITDYYRHSSLPLELAEHINREIGFRIGDTIPLQSLFIPGSRFRGIPPRTLASYNRALNALGAGSKTKVKTLGEIRGLSENELLNIRNIGIQSLAFIRTAFRKPSENIV